MRFNEQYQAAMQEGREDERSAKLDQLAAFIAAYEAEHGEITAEEMEAARERLKAQDADTSRSAV